MAKAIKEFKWEYSLVQDGMVYYRRVIPKELREKHELPRIIKKATGVKATDAAKAIAAITKLNALQEHEWSQLAKGNPAKNTLDKALQFLKDSRFNELSDDDFETHDMVIRDYFHELSIKGKISPEYALLAKMGDFRDPQTIPITLSIALAGYLKRHRNPSDGLIQDATRYIGNFIKLHEDLLVIDVNRSHVNDYVDHRLSKGIKTTTVRRELNQLSAIHNEALLEMEVDKRSPFASIKIPNEGNDATVKKPITSIMLDKLLATIRPSNTSSHLITKILLNTGMRIAELAVAKTSDVCLTDANGDPLEIPFIAIVENEFRSLKTKASARSVPLVGISLDAMKEAVRQAGNNEYLFPQYAKKVGGTNASSAVNASLEFVDINSHEFRHFISTRMREAMILQDVREAITGHSSKISSELENYGEGYKLKQLHPVLIKIAIH